MRLFAGINLPEEYKVQYSKIYPKLLSKYKNVKWIDPENLHITLAFFGEVNDSQVELIKKGLSKVEIHKSFNISFSSYEFMPNKNPRVIFQKLTNGFSLCKDLNLQMKKLFPDILTEKRAFKAHLTLGRLKSTIKINIPELEKLSYNFECSDFTLFKSELKRSGPVYFQLKKYIII